MAGGALLPVLSSQIQPPSAQLFQNVWNWYYFLGVGAGVVTFGLMIYLLVRYRDKPGREVAAERQKDDRETWKGALALFVLMGVILTAVGAQTLMAFPTYEHPPTGPGDLTVRVTAQQFFFTFTYPNNKTSNILVVPLDQVVVLNVTSKDVNHQFGIPYFRVKTDAIPGRFNVVWIQPNAIDNYTIQCFELCGVGHATMITTLAVLPSGSFSTWYNATQATPA